MTHPPEQLTLEPQERVTPEWEKWSQRERDVLRLYGDGLGRIPDEAAHELGKDFLYIRPAAAVLHKRGELRATGNKRKARNGLGRELVISERGLAVLREIQRRSA